MPDIKWTTDEMIGIVYAAQAEGIDEIEFVKLCEQWVLNGGVAPEELVLVEYMLSQKRLAMQKAAAAKRWRDKQKDGENVSD